MGVISTVCTDRGTLAPRSLCQLCADSGEKKFTEDTKRGHGRDSSLVMNSRGQSYLSEAG